MGRELAYLDNAATAYPKPREVHDFMCEFYRTCGVNPGRSGYDLSLEAEQMVLETRKMLTQFFNGGEDFNRLVFTYNASDSLNMIINGMLKIGDHVITSRLEHNSVLRPLYHKEMDRGVEVDRLPFDDRGYMDPDDVKRRIKKNTRLVIINHGSNVIGTLQPVAEIGRICKEKGVPFAVDVAQTAGATSIDMQAMCIDVLAFTGHKSLLGPPGIGGLCVRDGVEIEPSRFGGTGVRSAVKTHLYEYPYRLECGTMNLMGVAGLNAGVKYINRVGLENIHSKKMELFETLKTGLEEIEGVLLYCAEGTLDHLPVVSCNIQGKVAADVGTILDVDYDIAARTGLQCAPLVHEDIGTAPKGTVRFSIGAFNTEEHVERAVDAVNEIASSRSG
ncbi:aminotransferase class V-fold PLP-dependent enzyme [candidate division TA06 bacterium]|uniref:cysteine desulfurase n=1 Tax=candidate division TA06 bacterium TaxID=2250710 RepID=A0A523UXC9_UNCT6|nr:MAG: aminotransferase class V-fold PLP-dependent enzyme [candidate division TA06 bacterium]